VRGDARTAANGCHNAPKRPSRVQCRRLALSSLIHDFDAFFLQRLYGGPGGGVLTAAMVAITTLGGGWGMLGLVPLMAWPRTRRFSVTLTVVLAAVAAVVFALKPLVGRVRPCFCVPGIHAVCQHPMDYSFPSGHTAGSFAFAAFVATWAYLNRLPSGWLMSAGAILFAAAVGVSRIYLGVHFPSDVLGGAPLGIALGVAGAFSFRPDAPRKASVG
jgi:undecaprenyl-diphosphatase